METPYGPPSAQLVLGEIGRAEVAFLHRPESGPIVRREEGIDEATAKELLLGPVIIGSAKQGPRGYAPGRSSS